MTDQQRHDAPVRDHAVFSRHEEFLLKPGSDAARCMQDHSQHEHQEDKHRYVLSLQLYGHLR